MLLPLVLVGAFVAWALGVPGRRVVVTAGAASVLLVVSTIVLFGAVGLVEERGDGATGEADGATARPLRTRPVDVVLTDPDERADFPISPPPIVGLGDGDLLLVEADVGRRVVQVAQCVAGTRRCAPAVRVEPDDEGVVRTLVAFTRTIELAGGDVDCATAACVLALVAGDEVVRSVALEFGPPRPVPRLGVRAGEVRAGEDVVVDLVDFPGGPAVVTVCAPPGPSDPAACGAPAPEVEVDVPASGMATVRYPVEPGRVGSGGASCRRGEPCAIAVPGVAAAPVEITFASLADAEPPGRRLSVGLGAAAALLLGAAWLIRRTDWTPVDGDPFADVVLSDPFDDIDLGELDVSEGALGR